MLDVVKLPRNLDGSFPICGDVCESEELHVLLRSQLVLDDVSGELGIPVLAVYQKRYFIVVCVELGYVQRRIFVIVILVEFRLLS